MARDWKRIIINFDVRSGLVFIDSLFFFWCGNMQIGLIDWCYYWNFMNFFCHFHISFHCSSISKRFILYWIDTFFSIFNTSKFVFDSNRKINRIGNNWEKIFRFLVALAFALLGRRPFFNNTIGHYALINNKRNSWIYFLLYRKKTFFRVESRPMSQLRLYYWLNFRFYEQKTKEFHSFPIQTGSILLWNVCHISWK